MPKDPRETEGLTTIGRVRQFAEGRGRQVEVGGVKIAVFRRGSRFFAVDDRCPHMGASLSMGRLVGDSVECSWHGWKFDLATGRNAWKSWACVGVHEVVVRGDEVLVRLAPADADAPPTHGAPDDDWFVWDPDA